jgi:allantoin racemase
VSEQGQTGSMRLLLINPNTSAHITERLAASARRALPPGATLTALTAAEGPQAVRSAEEVPAATRNVINMARQHGPSHDAVLIGISLDCGLDDVRLQCAPQPVIGMTEAACLMACLHGPRFALLTLGGAMAPLYQAHVERLGLAQRLVGVVAPEMPQAFAAPADSVSTDVLEQLALAARSVLDGGADSLVLAGAVLCGYAPALSLRLGRPVLDGMVCAVQLTCARLSLPTA